MSRKPSLRVLMLSGGLSAERDVSLESGRGVTQALTEAGHRVTCFDPCDGHLHGVIASDYDVAFNALHGAFGEDGQVQQILEHLGLPYTGSGPAASRTAMSKSATKECLIEAGLPTPPHLFVFERDRAEDIRRKAATIGFPLVVKPDSQGSSLGVTIVSEPELLPAALNGCFHYGCIGMMEAAVLGAEWTVATIDDEALPPINIVPGAEFYDYSAKYESDATQFLFEGDLPQTERDHLRQLALRAGAAIGTAGVARVDFRLDRYRQPWILEINTIPGFTSHSLVPKAAERLGISFGQLCERALESALSSVATGMNADAA